MAELSVEEALAAELAAMRPPKLTSLTKRPIATTPSHRSSPKERKRKKSRRESKRIQSESTAIIAGVKVDAKRPKAVLQPKDTSTKSSMHSSARSDDSARTERTSAAVAPQLQTSTRHIQVVEFVDPDVAHRQSTSDATPSNTPAAVSDVEGAPMFHGGWIDPRQLLKDAARDIGDLNIASAQGMA